MNYTYQGSGKWTSCCASNRHDYHLPENKRVVALKGFITKFINWPNRGQVSIPANTSILNMPEDLIDSLLEQGLIYIVEERDFSNGVIL